MRGFISGLRILFAIGVAITLASIASAQAQTYPTKYITIVVPFAPGGPPDIYARMVAATLSDVLGQQVIVENRAGAAGTIGTASVVRAAPDGYTLLLADITFLVAPNLIANVQYAPLRDFVPVVSVSHANMFLVVNPSFPPKTVSDLVTMAKQKPGELQYVNPGLGTPPHLAALAFTRATATVMTPEKCQHRTCLFHFRDQFGCTPAASRVSCQNFCCDRRKVPNSSVVGKCPT